MEVIILLLALFASTWLIAVSVFAEQILRPMQTLANVVAALREDDFSFRARGARRGDALGDLALEINALAGTLQAQRSTALEALTLVERVMTSMQSPVLAFDGQNRLRLHNAAADRAFGLVRPMSDGRTAEELRLESLLEVTDEDIYSLPQSSRVPPGTSFAVPASGFAASRMSCLYCPTSVRPCAKRSARPGSDSSASWAMRSTTRSHRLSPSLEVSVRACLTHFLLITSAI